MQNYKYDRSRPRNSRCFGGCGMPWDFSVGICDGVQGNMHSQISSWAFLQPISGSVGGFISGWPFSLYFLPLAVTFHCTRSLKTFSRHAGLILYAYICLNYLNSQTDLLHHCLLFFHFFLHLCSLQCFSTEICTCKINNLCISQVLVFSFVGEMWSVLANTWHRDLWSHPGHSAGHSGAGHLLYEDLRSLQGSMRNSNTSFSKSFWNFLKRDAPLCCQYWFQLIPNYFFFFLM